MEDDFYGNQEDIPEVEKERLDREVQSVRREFVKAGIREGASSAREAHLQGGFDDGFAAGAKAAAAGGYL